MIGIGKSILTACVGLFLLAGPVAFSHPGCQMSCCCSSSDRGQELAFDKAPCCGCDAMGNSPAPIEPAVNSPAVKHENIRPEFHMDFPEAISIIENPNFAQRKIDIKSLSPPLIESCVNTPLIC